MNLRHSTRGLVLDPSDRLLLLRCELPDRSFWVAPGGGLEPGESHHDALARELREGDRVSVGNLELEVFDTEGHCDGHASYLLQGRDRRWRRLACRVLR